MNRREVFSQYIHALQDRICAGLEALDGQAAFEEDLWSRPGGGGGRTRIIQDGAVFEKGGVNISLVHGALAPSLKQQLGVQHEAFFACGLSLVIHPRSPMVPTVHANFRYFELYDAAGEVVDAWFGGGSDLTPYYLWPADAAGFHSGLRAASDAFDPALYPRFKEACDAYFFNTHRDEARGVGGVFFDYLREGSHGHSLDTWLDYTRAMGDHFLDSYAPIVRRRRDEPYGPGEKFWQEIRRGRYVEFNLIHDKGTLFGLRSGGRIESILMSLPATARWMYAHTPAPGSREDMLLRALWPRDWAALTFDPSETHLSA